MGDSKMKSTKIKKLETATKFVWTQRRFNHQSHTNHKNIKYKGNQCLTIDDPHQLPDPDDQNIFCQD